MSKQIPLTANPVLGVMPLRDMVVYPGMIVPLFVGREKSVLALEDALEDGEKIFLLAQKDANVEEPATDDLYTTGTVANVLQVFKLPDGSVKTLVEGLYRARVTQWLDDADYFMADIEAIAEPELSPLNDEALRRSVLEEFQRFAKNNKRISNEVVNGILELDSLTLILDTIAAQLQIKLAERQALLETADLHARAALIMDHLENETEISQMEKKIRGQVKRQMDKNQREYYLNEQIKAIHKELGEEEERAENDLLEDKIKQAKMSKEAEEVAMNELKKLKQMPPSSSEANIVKNYIEALIDLPWNKKSKVNQDIVKAQNILDEDHFGLEKVKERIVEYLAVQKRMKKVKSQILCLVGPPGVGKTSVGQSIARATGRKYVRMALGGVHDESEIRGHRRTYLGAMAGRIIRNLTKVETNNPLFLLDEVDKIGRDHRGDPADALLEVLDPEQNHSFNDNYIDVDFDLSDVMFVATANSLNIPAPLMDRMEIIHLSGYTEDEKIRIAMQYLIPKQIKNNGVADGEIEISEDAIQGIIRYYTREAGVRALDREIAKICRKVVKQRETADSIELPVKIDSGSLKDYLGVRRFDFGKADSQNRVGQVTGLAWTEVGGELLTIEAVALKGKGNIIRTGKLGDVMQESITAALSVVRSRAASLGIAPDFYEKHDIHLHVPEGATPKDGPSAGIAMSLAMVSALTKIPVRADVAMTGEITLRGEVLPIGGLKEKLLAALRGGIKFVLIPQDNVKDLEEIPDNVKQGLTIRPVKWIDEVFNFALERQPEPYQEPLADSTNAIIPPLTGDTENNIRRITH
ncbi:MAG: endopeptidase La [Neisseriaceae bacterium]|nr:endopeptidase La [Neisseriaceae bacterium]